MKHWIRLSFLATVLLVVANCGDIPLTSPADVAVAEQQLAIAGLPDMTGYILQPWLYDDGGVNDAPQQSDLNAFTRADNIGGMLGIAFTWDDTDMWGGSGQTGDACALFDTDPTPNGFADYALCVRITNDATGTEVLQVQGSPILYSCGDRNQADRCVQKASVVSFTPGSLTVCGVVKVLEDDASASSNAYDLPFDGDDSQDVLAGCKIDLEDLNATNAQDVGLVNVCSFPSGSPNSNPFDCVVKAGSGYIRLIKSTGTTSNSETFGFTLSPAATNGDTGFEIEFNAATTGSILIPVAPGTYEIFENSPLPSGWTLDTGFCEGSGDTFSGLKISNVAITTGVTRDCTFSNTVVTPSVTVTKTADPTTVAETGGAVTYSVDVTNTSALAVTLDSLKDNQFGNLDGQGTCDVPQTIAAAGAYSCEFEKTLAAAAAGSTHVNQVTAFVSNAGGKASASDTAKVTYTDVLPRIEVTKSAVAEEVPETGADVEFTVTVTNTGTVTVTLTDLDDTVYGDLLGFTECPKTAADLELVPGETYTCVFTREVSGSSTVGHSNTVTAKAVDDEGNEATDNETLAFILGNVAPEIEVTKTASKTSVPETGENVEFTVTVKNIGQVAVTLTDLEDDVFGDLLTLTECPKAAADLALDPDETYECKFTRLVSGDFGQNHVNTVTATAVDDDEEEVTDEDDATVQLTDVKPDISVTKTADPDTLSTVDTGTGLPAAFANAPEFEVGDNGGGGGGPQASTCDDKGANDVNSKQVDLNCMGRDDSGLPNALTVSWSWDSTDQWPGTGATGDACALLDSDNDGFANYAVCARIQNNAAGAIVQVPSAGHADVYSCTDSKEDRCASPNALVAQANIGITSCTVGVQAVDPYDGNGKNRGDNYANDVVAECDLDLSEFAGVDDLLNVCSFPSGSPNSNPFDCVVTAGVGFVRIVKDVNVFVDDEFFGFTLSPASTDGTSKYKVEGDAQTSLIPVAPGTGFSIVETLPLNSSWQLASVSCSINEVAKGTVQLGSLQVISLPVEKGQTTVCTFTNDINISGSVEFTIVVTNNGAEEATLTKLDDSEFEDLLAGTTPICPVADLSIPGGQTYTCVFTKTLSGAPGTTHENTVTAEASDDDGNDDSAQATETVDFVADTP